MKNYEQFHDGYLDGLLIEEMDAFIFLSTDEKERSVLIAGNVLALNATNFLKRNIIFDVVTRQDAELTAPDIRAVYGLQNPHNVAAENTHVEKILSDVHANGGILLEITPSYGASCLLLARSIELLPHSEGLRRLAN
jgi:hypothetical protein